MFIYYNILLVAFLLGLEEKKILHCAPRYRQLYFTTKLNFIV